MHRLQRTDLPRTECLKLRPLGLLFISIVFNSAYAGAHIDRPPPAEPLTPVPTTISEKAQDFYRSWRPRGGNGADMRNPKILKFTRDFLGKMFLKNAERAGLDYELQAAELDSVEAYWLRPPSVIAGPALIYLHGGGYILGSAKTNLVLPVRVSEAAQMPVLSVEYRLAPEYPFPAGLDDAVSAYQALLKAGYDPKGIGVFGDSAGGGLTLALALRLRELELPQPGALVAISPSTDRTRAGDTQATLSDFDVVLGPLRPGEADLYAGDAQLDHPLVSPVYADLRGIAPLLIQVGTRERLLSDAIRLARNARRDKVDCTLDVWEGMWHVWQDHPTIPEAQQATQEIGEFFRARLADGASEAVAKH